MSNIRRELTLFEQMVFDELAEAGLSPVLFCSASSGSCYFRFKEKGLRSLRIGNHEGRKKYSYKWNLRQDYAMPADFMDGAVRRFVYPFRMHKEMVKHMKNYANKIDKK